MTGPFRIDPVRFLHERLASASPDLVRLMLTTFINTLMSAEANAVCNAGYGQRSAERVNVRNGYRHRDFDTRAGTLDVAIPEAARGQLIPDWLLERRRRAERTLTTVVANCYLLGVSIRRMERLVESDEVDIYADHAAPAAVADRLSTSASAHHDPPNAWPRCRA